jgi:hypothetical protein
MIIGDCRSKVLPLYYEDDITTLDFKISFKVGMYICDSDEDILYKILEINPNELIAVCIHSKQLHALELNNTWRQVETYMNDQNVLLINYAR